jgi:hypothetical protein
MLFPADFIGLPCHRPAPCGSSNGCVGMPPLAQSQETPVLVAEAVGDFCQGDSVNPARPRAARGNGTGDVQHVDPEALLVLADWHERRALEQDRFASNAETDLWRTGCERRARFHRMIGEYLRALHVDVLNLTSGHTHGDR